MLRVRPASSKVSLRMTALLTLLKMPDRAASIQSTLSPSPLDDNDDLGDSDDRLEASLDTEDCNPITLKPSFK